jgi:ankyrin repeat protein
MFHHKDVVERLLQHPSVQVNTIGRSSPLHYACCLSDYTIVTILLNHPQIDIMAINECGNIPLHWASRAEKETIVPLLLAHGARQQQLIAFDIWKETPLHSVCMNCRSTTILRTLLDYSHEMNMNAKSHDGSTPLHFLCRRYDILLLNPKDETISMLHRLLEQPSLLVEQKRNGW